MMKLFFIAMAALLVPLSAQALTVNNLDVHDHRVVFEDTYGSKQVIIVPAGGVFHSIRHGGQVYVEGTRNKVWVRQNDVLAIWKDGNIQLQKRRLYGPNQ